MIIPKSLRPLLLAAAVCFAGGAPSLSGQATTVRADDNLRAEPNGGVIGRLLAGTTVQIDGADGGWSRVTVEGVMWMRSLQVLRDEGFDLVVSEPGGENLRDDPQGRIAGTLMQGTRLEELERMTGWIRVRRTGWIWTPSLQPVAGAPTPTPARTEGGAGPGRADTLPPRADPVAAEGRGADPWLSAGPRGAPILASVDGDTLGVARSGTELRVMAREGNWARVQMEGWVWIPAAGAADAPVEGQILRGMRASELGVDRDRYRGRVVELTLQFISLERAEQVRTDFFEGEPFLLTRSTEGERLFVYVAVPVERLAEMQRLVPLERIRVTGRVRAGAASLTGSPILDLLEVRRER